MNRIKNFFTAKWCALISALLGALGFAATGCDNFGAELYGQPYAKFKMEGAVLNEDGDAVDGAKVYVRHHYGDTAKTAQDGKFLFDAKDFMSYSYFWAMAEDPSGTYQPDSVKIEPKFEGGDGDWYEGSYSTTHNFTLKKKEPEPDKN